MLAYLGLGTNLGNKERNLHCALAYIGRAIGPVVSVSDFIDSRPWGFVSRHRFLNAVCAVRTRLTPWQLLDRTQHIERLMGRKHKTVDACYADRLIDIDLLLYGSRILRTPRLTLPHPHLTERDFVLKPLRAIAPEVVHPVCHTRLVTLCARRMLHVRILPNAW